jgi:ribonuclease HI
MISNRSHHENEATLFFDGGAQPNPGKGGAGWWIYDDVRDRELTRGSERVPHPDFGNGYDVTNNIAEVYNVFN